MQYMAGKLVASSSLSVVTCIYVCRHVAVTRSFFPSIEVSGSFKSKATQKSYYVKRKTVEVQISVFR